MEPRQPRPIITDRSECQSVGSWSLCGSHCVLMQGQVLSSARVAEVISASDKRHGRERRDNPGQDRVCWSCHERGG